MSAHLQQLVDLGAVVGRQRDADADVDHDLMAVQIVGGPGHRVPERLRQHGGVGRMLEAGLHDRELVAAQPRQDVALAADSRASARPPP